MLVKEAMSKNPEYLPPHTTLKKAAEEMQKHDFGFIPIGENDKLIGVVTDRDLTVRGTANGKDPNQTPVSDVMTDAVFYCYEDDNVTKAAEDMRKLQIHRLIVLNKSKRMTGVLSLGDLAKHTHNDSLCGHVIEGISETRH